MNNATLKTTATNPGPSPAAFSASELFATERTHFSRNTLTGNFSLIDDAPLCIDTVPGMELYVNAGSIRTKVLHGTCTRETCAGQRFVADDYGVLMVHGRAGVELEVAWPV